MGEFVRKQEICHVGEGLDAGGAWIEMEIDGVDGVTSSVFPMQCGQDLGEVFFFGVTYSFDFAILSFVG